ncbi:unnamed protein product, partial [Urochloa humidicola]
SELPAAENQPWKRFSHRAHTELSPYCCFLGALISQVTNSKISQGIQDFLGCRMPELEPPFRPREKLLELQKYFQNIQKHTYLKGRYDAVTSVGIPLALAASSLFLIGRGVYNMSHGIGKKE